MTSLIGDKMRMVILDGKRLGIVMIISGLMCILFGFGMTFGDNIRATAFIESNMGTLKQYYIDKYNINYKLPLSWKTNLNENLKGIVIYENDFESEDSSIKGFIQLLNCNDLNEGIDKSIIFSPVGNYKITKIIVNNMDGYEVNYILKKDGVSFNCIEYFIKDKEKVLRFSFYITNNNNENMYNILNAIVNTASS